MTSDECIQNLGSARASPQCSEKEKVRDGGAPSPAREARALPRAHRSVHCARRASSQNEPRRAGKSTMSVLGIGVDMVEVERIQHSLDRFGERFMKRVFTEGEIAYCMSMKFPARHFAARFAAKEAVSKAFGTGIGKAMGWRDIDVHKKESGEPFLVLHGGADALAQERLMKSAWISLSHTEHHAVAMIALET